MLTFQLLTPNVNKPLEKRTFNFLKKEIFAAAVYPWIIIRGKLKLKQKTNEHNSNRNFNGPANSVMTVPQLKNDDVIQKAAVILLTSLPLKITSFLFKNPLMYLSFNNAILKMRVFSGKRLGQTRMVTSFVRLLRFHNARLSRDSCLSKGTPEASPP